MYSGLRFENEAQFARDANVYQRTAKACLDHGMRLYYHNHDFEFDNGGKVINGLLALKDPEVELCVDVGWVVKGGEDVLAFLKRAKKHVGVIHAKDFASGKTDPKVSDIVPLGQGIVPFAKIAELFKDCSKEMWVVAEQDFAAAHPEQAVAANAKFLHKVF